MHEFVPGICAEAPETFMRFDAMVCVAWKRGASSHFHELNVILEKSAKQVCKVQQIAET